MALKEVLALFDFSVTGVDKLDKADQKTTGLTKSIQALGGVLGGLAAIGVSKGLFDFVNETADAADQTDKFATAIGSSAREVAEWDIILGNAGLNLEKGRAGIRTFTKQAGEASKGNKDLQKTFRDLGVASKGADGQIRPLNDRLTDTVLGLAKIEDPAKRAATAEKLFGEAGAGFVRVALDGAEALEAQRAEFEALLGGGSYDQFVQDSKAAAVANDRWRNATGALRVAIASTLVPILTRVIVAIANVTKAFTKLIRDTAIIRVGLTTLGAVAAAFALKLAIAFAPAILTVGLFVAAAGAAILIIEDLYQLFTGGESLIGQWLAQFLGAEKARNLIQAIKDSVIELAPVFVKAGKVIAESLKDGLERLKDILGFIGDVIENLGDIGETIGGTLAGFKGLQTRGAELADPIQQRIAETRRKTQEVFVFGRELAPEELAARKAVVSGTATEEQRATAERVRQLGLSLQAPPLEAAGAGGTGGSVAVTNQTQITVQGSADPDETAQRVMEAMDAREQDTYRRARDLATAR